MSYMSYAALLKPLLVDCEYGDIGTGSPPELVEFHERQFGIRFPIQYRNFFLEVGWFLAAVGSMKVGIYGDGDEVGPYLWIEFNNQGFENTDWLYFGEHSLWGRNPQGFFNIDVIYEDWFAFRQGTGEILEPQVYRFRRYSDWISDDMRDEKIPGEEWLLAYPDFDAWLSATVALLREAAQKQGECR